MSIFPWSKNPKFFEILQQASSNAASERILHFFHLREISTTLATPLKLQVDSLFSVLNECADNSKKNPIYVLDVILMLSRHGHNGFVEELTQPERLQFYVAYLCDIRDKSLYAAKKMAWLIKTLYSRYASPPGHFSRVVATIDASMPVGLDAFSQDSWIPNMSTNEYYHLVNKMCDKYHEEISTFDQFMAQINNSSDLPFLESKRRIIEGVHRRLVDDLKFLAEIRNFFSLPNPQNAIELLNVNLEQAMKQIDFLVNALKQEAPSGGKPEREPTAPASNSNSSASPLTSCACPHCGRKFGT